MHRRALRQIIKDPSGTILLLPPIDKTGTNQDQQPHQATLQPTHMRHPRAGQKHQQQHIAQGREPQRPADINHRTGPFHHLPQTSVLQCHQPGHNLRTETGRQSQSGHQQQNGHTIDQQSSNGRNDQSGQSRINGKHAKAVNHQRYRKGLSRKRKPQTLSQPTDIRTRSRKPTPTIRIDRKNTHHG